MKTSTISTTTPCMLYKSKHYIEGVDSLTSTIIIQHLPLILDIDTFSLHWIRKRVIFERHFP